MTSAFRRIHRRDFDKEMAAIGNWFFYRPFHTYFFQSHEHEGIVFATLSGQNIARFFYVASAILFLEETPLFKSATSPAGANVDDQFNMFWIILSCFAILLISFTFGDYLPRILGMRLPEKVLRFCTPFASLFMFLSFPITYIFLKISHAFSRTVNFDHFYEPDSQAKQEIIDIIQDAELSPGINRHDKKLFESVLSFRDRIVREVMVPRVNVFSISDDMSIREAAGLIGAEGYSRTPVYQNTIDEITGVLMYKDILRKYREYKEKDNDDKILDAPVSTIQKRVLFTPETKKISNLLQEFRKKQMHLAIVVDEYGGTKGIVTIEDILEEIVGEIADEYDQDVALYIKQVDGSWIIDARMNIIDLEDNLNLVIPQEGDYDTIGGYVFHCAGAIPNKGFVIHQDAFEIEVLSSNERVVEKVRIRSIKQAGEKSKRQIFEEEE